MAILANAIWAGACLMWYLAGKARGRAMGWHEGYFARLDQLAALMHDHNDLIRRYKLLRECYATAYGRLKENGLLGDGDA